MVLTHLQRLVVWHVQKVTELLGDKRFKLFHGQQSLGTVYQVSLLVDRVRSEAGFQNSHLGYLLEHLKDYFAFGFLESRLFA